MSLYDDVTPDSIKADIIENYQGNLDTREGSFFDFIISPLVWELYKNYKAQEAFLSILFPDETSGEWIDEACATVGITRKSGTYANAEIIITGTAGITVPAGTSFLTTDGREYTLDSDVVLTGGEDVGALTATEIGAFYNADEGAICQMYVNVPGVSSYSVGKATGGTDNESNAALIARLDAYRKHPSSSGNAADYEAWALSVDGIGAAYVIPEWDGAGTVKVIISAADGSAATDDMITAVANYIETVRPIGPIVTVVSAVEQSIDVAVQIVLDGTVDVPDITECFNAALQEYLSEIGISGGVISYNQIAYMLLSLDGVSDFTSLLVNGGTASVTLDAGTSPVPGTVTISEGTP